MTTKGTGNNPQPQKQPKLIDATFWEEVSRVTANAAHHFTLNLHEAVIEVGQKHGLTLEDLYARGLLERPPTEKLIPEAKAPGGQTRNKTQE